MLAFITGITGQDGSYLADKLISNGYIVHGLIRRSSQINTQRIEYLYQDPHESNKRLILHYGDLLDACHLANLINKIRPHEVYNLAAMSHVGISFDSPQYTTNVIALGTINLLEACKPIEGIKIYQASTSEMFGGLSNCAYNEDSPMDPRSPYAAAKLFAHNMVKIYRESYSMFVVSGILFNHTSPKRGHNFVEQKIVQAAVKIKNKMQDCLFLGNIYARRDIGHARDYVTAMHAMLQQQKPQDFVIASGHNVEIKTIVDKVFSILSMPLQWRGSGLLECAMHKNTVIVKIDKHYFRPLEVETLLGDASNAKNILNWNITMNIDDILKEMIDSESAKY